MEDDCSLNLNKQFVLSNEKNIDSNSSSNEKQLSIDRTGIADHQLNGNIVAKNN